MKKQLTLLIILLTAGTVFSEDFYPPHWANTENTIVARWSDWGYGSPWGPNWWDHNPDDAEILGTYETRIVPHHSPDPRRCNRRVRLAASSRLETQLADFRDHSVQPPWA